MRRILLSILVLCLVGCAKENTGADYLERAQAYIEDADYTSARIELKNALQLHAGDAQARCLLGRLQFEAGNMLDAQKELQRGRALGCSEDTVLPVLAQSYLALGEFDDVLSLESGGLGDGPYAHLLALQSIASLNKGLPEQAEELVALALERSPASIPAQLARARIEAETGDTLRAIEMVDAILTIAPESHEAWRLKGHIHWRALWLPQARAAFDKAIAYTRMPVADYVSRGLINIQMEDYSAAQQDAAALAEIAQSHPGSSYINGLLLFHAGEYRDAITMLSLGEAAARKYPLMLFYLAVAHIIDGDAKVAETYAERYLELMPESLEGRRLLAVLLMQRDAIAASEAILSPVLDYDANDLGALNIMANALLRDDRADLGMYTFDRIAKTYPDITLADMQITDGLFTSRLALSAKEAVQQALRPLPETPRKDVLTVLALLKKNDRKGAVKAATSYKWRDLTGVAPHNVLGNVQVAIENDVAARKMFNQALKRKPGDPSANLNLAKLERKAGDTAKERAHYEAILRAQPDHLPTLLSLAVLEGREGNNGEMVDLLREAVDRHPGAVEPRLGLARYYIDSGRAAKVETVFDSLPGLQKHSKKVRAMRYAALLGERQFDKALALARQEYARNPKSETMLEVVFLLQSMNQKNEVVSVLRGWIAVSPADISARLMLAGELEATDLAGASAQYRAVLEYQPDHVMALNNLAWNIRHTDPAQSLALIRKAAALSPRRPAILDSLAVIAHLNGEHEEASVAIAAAVKGAPKNLNMRYHQAMINAGQGETAQAVAALKHIISRNDVKFERREEARQLLKELQARAPTLSPPGTASG